MAYWGWVGCEILNLFATHSTGTSGNCSFSSGWLWGSLLVVVVVGLLGTQGPCVVQAADLQLEMTRAPQKKPDPSEALIFGKTFTDHMLMVEWSSDKGWAQPRIQPFQNLSLHPACSALHYSLQVLPSTSQNGVPES